MGSFESKKLKRKLIPLFIVFSLLYLTVKIYMILYFTSKRENEVKYLKERKISAFAEKRKKISETFFSPNNNVGFTYSESNFNGNGSLQSNQSNNDSISISSPGNRTLVISALPVPAAFSESTFYGNRGLLKYKWYFTPKKEKVSPLNYSFLDGSANACASEERHQLIILIMSLHNMTSQRQAIRDTWGSVSRLRTWPGSRDLFYIKLLFVLGVSRSEVLNTAVRWEGKENGDLIIADFLDTYYNLSLRVLIGFKWIKMFCPAARYVMKIDEDTYVNIPMIAKVIESQTWNNKIYGPFFYSGLVARQGKHRLSKEFYPPDVYPPHVKGNLYFMQTTVAFNILTVSEYMPYNFIEDVYITGILAKTLNVQHTALTLDLYDLHSPARSCDLVTGKKMVSQQIFRETFYDIWSKAENISLCSRGTLSELKPV